MENVTRRGFMAALAAGALAPAGAFADDGAALSSKMKVKSTSACPPSQPPSGGALHLGARASRPRLRRV